MTRVGVWVVPPLIHPSFARVIPVPGQLGFGSSRKAPGYPGLVGLTRFGPGQTGLVGLSRLNPGQPRSGGSTRVRWVISRAGRVIPRQPGFFQCSLKTRHTRVEPHGQSAPEPGSTRKNPVRPNFFTVAKLHAIERRHETREQTVTDGPAVALNCRFPRLPPSHACQNFGSVLSVRGPCSISHSHLTRSHAHPGLGTYAWTHGRASTPWLSK